MSVSFDKMGLRPEILRAINDLGFSSPTAVQQQTVPMLIAETRDMVALAQTGTGKTAAFGLPLLQNIDEDFKQIQAVVLCPTRELCVQISNDLKNFSKYMGRVNVVPVYGGTSIVNQERDIRRGAHVIVATPGRMMDLMERGVIKLHEVRIAVLDEADEMLNMGFQEDIDLILSKTPDTKNTWLFSATMPQEVARIAKKYLSDPLEVTVGKKNSSAENLTHSYYIVKERDRYPALKRIIDFNPDIFGLIFCRTKHGTRTVADKLIKDGYNCEALHGDLTQSMRDSVMLKFRERTIKLLVATDVAARGIDVSEITHVIHYELPDDSENYTHRSGRTARAGKSGKSLCLINTREIRRIRDLERITNKKFEPALIPNPKEVCEVQLMALLDKMMATEINRKEIEPYLKKVFDRFADLTKEEVITRFVSAEFNRFLEYYRNAGDLNANANDRGDGRDRDRYDKGDRKDFKSDRGGKKYGGGTEHGYERLFINAGSSEGVNKGKLVRIICDTAGITSKELGRIDIREDFSFVDVKEQMVAQVFKSLGGARVEGRKWRIERANEKSSGGGGGADRGGFKEKTHRSSDKKGDRDHGKGKRLNFKKKNFKF